MYQQIKHGYLIGSSQLKFVSAERLQLNQKHFKTTTYSLPGAVLQSGKPKNIHDFVISLRLAPVDFVAIYIGGNDLDNGMCVDTVVAEVTMLADWLLNSIAQKVLVFTLAPRTGIFHYERHKRYNEALRIALRNKPNVDLIDLWTAMTQLDGSVQHQMLSDGDGYHINPGKGISKLCAMLRAALERVYSINNILLLRCINCGACGHSVQDCNAGEGQPMPPFVRNQTVLSTLPTTSSAILENGAFSRQERSTAPVVERRSSGFLGRACPSRMPYSIPGPRMHGGLTTPSWSTLVSSCVRRHLGILPAWRAARPQTFFDNKTYLARNNSVPNKLVQCPAIYSNPEQENAANGCIELKDKVKPKPEFTGSTDWSDLVWRSKMDEKAPKNVDRRNSTVHMEDPWCSPDNGDQNAVNESTSEESLQGAGAGSNQSIDEGFTNGCKRPRHMFDD